MTGAQSVVDPGMLEACGRDVLNKTAPRYGNIRFYLDVICYRNYLGRIISV